MFSPVDNTLFCWGGWGKTGYSVWPHAINGLVISLLRSSSHCQVRDRIDPKHLAVVAYTVLLPLGLLNVV